MRQRWWNGVVCLIAAGLLAGVAVRMDGRRIAAADFVVPTVLPVPAVARSDAYPQPMVTGAAHAPAAVVLADGRIAAFWFQGSREAASDVRLKSSVFADGAWGPIRDVTDGVRTGADEGRIIKTVGNPIVFRHPDGEFWLVYVSVTVGGWSGSSLNLMRSPDGIAWGPARRLVTSPFLDVSTLDRSPPLLRSDGLVALPVYHEMITSYPLLLFLDRNGAVVDRARMGGRCQIQPWLVPLGGGKALALMREHSCASRRLWQTVTTDGGLSWGPVTDTGFADPDAPAAAVRLSDGRIAAVVNDDARSAAVLRLAFSADDGATWQRGPAVFDGGTTELDYRYPWMLQDQTGRLHVLISESKRAIRDAVLGAGDLVAAKP